MTRPLLRLFAYAGAAALGTTLTACSSNDVQARSLAARLTLMQTAPAAYAQAKAGLTTADIVLSGVPERISRLDATGLQPGTSYTGRYHLGRCTPSGSELGTAVGEALNMTATSSSLTLRQVQALGGVSAAQAFALYQVTPEGQTPLLCVNLSERG
ncbi:hypothetical protein ACFP81_04710 [Deinococcus lacus]|uniref:Lipoprotein n=1 Tax=Deinococcus lacus TaxID=392561 RepID=A0ABW1YBK6_9DEIO